MKHNESRYEFQKLKQTALIDKDAYEEFECIYRPKVRYLDFTFCRSNKSAAITAVEFFWF